jgi:hypothetical protein
MGAERERLSRALIVTALLDERKHRLSWILFYGKKNIE